MKTYEITYVETFRHTFYVDANSLEEAEEKFHEDANNFDFSNGECCDSYVDYITEVT